jgi:hypothetical protein
MNGMKALKATAMALSVAALAGCGQGYSPEANQHIADPRGGDGVFNNGSDQTVYKTASYDVLRTTLVSTMMVTDVAQASIPTAECSAAVVTAGQCPKYQPLAFLAKNSVALGAPIYSSQDPNSTQVPGPMTTGGFKAWVLASTSASGLMMQQHPDKLFVNGDVTNFDLLFESLLGRLPTQDEVARLTQVEADIAAANPTLTGTPLAQRQGAAAVSSVLSSLEFLMVN